MENKKSASFSDEQLKQLAEETKKAAAAIPAESYGARTQTVANEDIPMPEDPDLEIIPVSEIGYTEAPEVAQQRKQLYAELDAVMTARSKQADAREKSLITYAKNLKAWGGSLEEKSAQIKQEEIDSKRNIEKYRTERMNACEERERAVSDREDMVTFREQNLEMAKNTLEMEKAAFEEMKALTIANGGGGSEMATAALQVKLDELVAENDSLREVCGKKDTLINAYQARYEEDRVKLSQQDAAAKAMRETYTDLEQKYENLYDEYEDAVKELEEFRSHTPVAEADKLLAALNEEGIRLQRMEEEGSPVLRGVKDGIKISIYTDINLLVCSKEIKLTRAIEKNLDRWNAKSNRCTYLFLDGSIICRYVAADPIDSAVKLIASMNKL